MPNSLLGIIDQSSDEKILSYWLVRTMAKWRPQHQRLTWVEKILAVISFGDLGFRCIFQSKLNTNSCLAHYLGKSKAEKRCFKFHSTATPQVEQASPTEEACSPSQDQSALQLWRLSADLESFKLSQSLFTSTSLEAERGWQKNIIYLFFWTRLWRRVTGSVNKEMGTIPCGWSQLLTRRTSLYLHKWAQECVCGHRHSSTFFS